MLRKLDYCNSLLYGMFNNMMQKIQSVQNATAHLATRTQHWKHITPVLQKSHWLCIRWRVEFKFACLVHQSLAGQTLTYLASGVQLTADTGCAQLRSATERMRVVPHIHNSFGDLPPHLPKITKQLFKWELLEMLVLAVKYSLPIAAALSLTVWSNLTSITSTSNTTFE